MSAVAELIDDPAALPALAADWDALAVACGRPLCAPAWMLAWLRHAAPADVAPRVVAVRDGGELVGLAPFALGTGRAGIRRLGLLAADVSAGTDVLSRPGREREVADAVATVLRAPGGADVLAFDGVAGSSPWPGLLGARLGGGGAHALRRTLAAASPAIDLAATTADGWLAARSAGFRKRMRQIWRRLERDGGRARMTERPEEIGADLAAFARLHHGRWDFRGGSGVLRPGVDRMLEAAAATLVADARLRLWTLEVGGRPVCSQLFLAAGGEVTWWLGGFDPAWARESPTLALLLRVVEDAFARGDHRLGLGAGGQAYKYRFADPGPDARVAWSIVPLPGPRLPLVLGEVAARRARRIMRERRERAVT